MHTFTSRDLKAGAFPQVGVDPLDGWVSHALAAVAPGASSRSCAPGCCDGRWGLAGG